MWLDGSVVGGRRAGSHPGGRWRKDGWTTEFGASPPYPRRAGQPDGELGVRERRLPMAARPDQIWIDGVAQRQVSSLAAVGPGTFFHDQAANQLWLRNSTRPGRACGPATSPALWSGPDKAASCAASASALRPSVPGHGRGDHRASRRPRRERRDHRHVDDRALRRPAPTGRVVLRNLCHAPATGCSASAHRPRTTCRSRTHCPEDNNTGALQPVRRSPAGPRSTGPAASSCGTASSAGTTARASGWTSRSTTSPSPATRCERRRARHVARALVKGVCSPTTSSRTTPASESDQQHEQRLGVEQHVRRQRPQHQHRAGLPPADECEHSRARQAPAVPRPDHDVAQRSGDRANNIFANQRPATACCASRTTPKERTAEQIGVTASGRVQPAEHDQPDLVVVWSAGEQPTTTTTLTAFRSATGQGSAGQLVNGSAIVDANGSATLVKATVVANTALRYPQTSPRAHREARPRPGIRASPVTLTRQSGYSA